MSLLSAKIVRSVLAIEVNGTAGCTSGTAFFTAQGIVTAYHTLEQAGNDREIFVYNPKIKTCRAALVAKDEGKDLALLRITARAKRRYLLALPCISGVPAPLQLPEQDCLVTDASVFIIGYLWPEKPRVSTAVFNTVLDPHEESLSLSSTIVADPDALRASFFCTYSPGGFSGAPIVTADGSLVSVVSTWHQFFGETRGATLPQLREFLLKHS